MEVARSISITTRLAKICKLEGALRYFWRKKKTLFIVMWPRKSQLERALSEKSCIHYAYRTILTSSVTSLHDKWREKSGCFLTFMCPYIFLSPYIEKYILDWCPNELLVAINAESTKPRSRMRCLSKNSYYMRFKQRVIHSWDYVFKHQKSNCTCVVKLVFYDICHCCSKCK